MIIRSNKTVTCKNCGSQAVVKLGTYKGAQRFYCKSCNRKFKADSDPFHMKTPIEQVSRALAMYHLGMSVREIKELLIQEYHDNHSMTTIYKWIDRYSSA